MHKTFQAYFVKILVEKLIPTEEPTEEEKKAIREKDEIASEEELMKTLS
jgi:hypothetical protein